MDVREAMHTVTRLEGEASVYTRLISYVESAMPSEIEDPDVMPEFTVHDLAEFDADTLTSVIAKLESALGQARAEQRALLGADVHGQPPEPTEDNEEG